MSRHRAVYQTYCQLRHASTKTQKAEKQKAPHIFDKSTHDLIGPPDKESNLRPIRFFIPENESKNAKSYREQRSETQQWNQAFWADHNKRFYQLKEEFVKNKIKEKKEKAMASGQEVDEILSAEEMSMFYKKFLDENYKSHKAYNREWYKRNIMLLWPAFKVTVEKFIKKLGR